MTKDSNIDKFNHIVAMLFSQLYSEFPRRLTISPAELLGLEIIEESYDSHDILVRCIESGLEKNIACSELEIVVDTIQWLSDSSYIYIEDSNGYHWVSGLTLSEKGLDVLKSTPESLPSKMPLGEQISRAVKSGAKHTMTGLVQTVLSQGLHRCKPRCQASPYPRPASDHLLSSLSR